MTKNRKVIQYVSEACVAVGLVVALYYGYRFWKKVNVKEKPPVITIDKDHKFVFVAEYKGIEIFALYKNDSLINLIPLTPKEK